MKLEDLDYDLPDDLIAQAPLADRADSRLLHLNRATGRVEHRQFRDCAELLRSGDLLVLNDTRVSAARLHGRKTSGGKVELLVLAPGMDGAYSALARPARTLSVGAVLEMDGLLTATIIEKSGGGSVRVRFSSAEALQQAMQNVSAVPLPPYIRRAIEDPERYQTVYARRLGSAAAPTAGLHFTRGLLDQLTAREVAVATVTLDVGIDTFRPMTVEPERHAMHGERCEVSEATADAIAACRGRIVAVGTTTVRTLESFAVGPKCVEPGSKTTKLLIMPGYEFQIIDGMFTNFHMPRTTMLSMLYALANADAVRKAYREAIRERYRFLSFGDSMLIL